MAAKNEARGAHAAGFALHLEGFSPPNHPKRFFAFLDGFMSEMNNKKSLKTVVFRQIVVEVRRIELLSEKATARLSPSAVCDFKFPHPDARRQA